MKKKKRTDTTSLSSASIGLLPRRKAKQVTIRLGCKDNTDHYCEINGSVRSVGFHQGRVAMFMKYGDGWAHMTPKQARKLSEWLQLAALEAESR